MPEDYEIIYCPTGDFRTGATFPKMGIYAHNNAGNRTNRPSEWLPVGTVVKALSTGLFMRVDTSANGLFFAICEDPRKDNPPAKTTARVMVWKRTQEIATRPGYRMAAVKVG